MAMANEVTKDNLSSSDRLSRLSQWLRNLPPQKLHETNQHNGKSIFQKIFSFFSGLFGKKHKHHSHATPAAITTAANEPNIANTVIKGPSPSQEPSAVVPTSTNDVTTVDLGSDQKPVDVQLKIQSDKPNEILSSSNSDDYKFLEVRNVDGIEKEADLDKATKDKIAKATADVEEQAYRKTAEDMGFDIEKIDLGNGQTKYAITDPSKGGQPITSEQMQQFRTMSVKNFNDSFNTYLQENPDLGFKLFKEITKQAGLSNTVSEQSTNSPENKPTPSKDIPSKDGPSKDTKEEDQSTYKSPSPFQDPAETPTLSFGR